MSRGTCWEPKVWATPPPTLNPGQRQMRALLAHGVRGACSYQLGLGTELWGLWRAQLYRGALWASSLLPAPGQPTGALL